MRATEIFSTIDEFVQFVSLGEGNAQFAFRELIQSLSEENINLVRELDDIVFTKLQEVEMEIERGKDENIDRAIKNQFTTAMEDMFTHLFPNHNGSNGSRS